MFYALNQKDVLVAGIQQPEVLQGVQGAVHLRHAARHRQGLRGQAHADVAKSKQILKAEGYDGTPIVLLYATDTNTGRLTPILKALLERGGFNVDMQAMDWNTVVARRTRKEPPSAGGWHGFLTTLGVGRPARSGRSFFLGANCEKAAIGWPCDEKIEKLRDDFAAHDRCGQAQGTRRRRSRCGMSEYPTYVPLGQFNMPSRCGPTCRAIIEAPATVFWNVKKAP